MDTHDQPTEPWDSDATGRGPSPAGSPTGSPAGSPGGPRTKRVSRRTVVMGLTGVGAVAAAGGIAAGAYELSHTANTQQAMVTQDQAHQMGHLLRRAGFGATSEELASYAQLGFTGAVDRLLNYAQVSDDALEQRLKAANLDLQKLQDQQRWWLLRMAWTQRPLLEKMTLFWHGVLTSSSSKVGGKQGYMRMFVQNGFLRAHAFDTFDAILLGITRDPAMLYYLDLNSSHKNAPNENYARELMELFTVGLGNYTQKDVEAGALALTGWHVRGSATTAVYRPNDHTTESLTYLGHTSNLDYKDVVTILAAHPATAAALCHKLYTFFVHEQPTTTDLQPLIDSYHSSNHNVGAVVRALLLSPQFSSSTAYRSRIKSPAEFTIGAYRALNIQSNGKELPTLLTSQGQQIFNPPNVAGWPGDKVSALWMNSGTWMIRLNYVNQLLVGSRNKVSSYQADLQGMITNNKLTTPEQFVDHCTTFLLDGQLDPARRTEMLSYLTTKDAHPTSAKITLGSIGYSASRVRGALYLLMASPEYQLN